MHLQYSGLSTDQAQEKQKQYGLNDIPEVKESILHKLRRWFVSPITGMLLAASILSFVTNKVFDAYFILALLFLNSGISIWQEGKADTAIKKLNEHLRTSVSVLRDNVWKKVDSRELVPGDVIKIKTGDVAPVDGYVLEAVHASTNESALTGESLPKEKKVKDMVYSGSFVETGIITMQVSATGKNTYFGKTIFSVEKTKKRSILEQDIIRISQFLSLLSLGAVVLLSVIFLLQKAPMLDLLTLDLSLVIAGIPISLPTIMTLIIALGVVELAKKQVVVRRLSALEDLANVNMLLTDKTGTLTENKITVHDIIPYNNFTEKEALSFAWLLSSLNDEDPLDIALSEKATQEKIEKISAKAVDIIPPDSVRKRNTGVFLMHGKDYVVSLGAPQIIESLCHVTASQKSSFYKNVEDLANKGYRTIAVAVKEGSKTEDGMRLVALFALADTPRPDAAHVMQFMQENGINVAMVTGDNRAISTQIAQELAIPGDKIMTRDELHKMGMEHITSSVYAETQAFAEVYPEDKLHLVEQAKHFFIVAANGDGINDLPAIKAANVGIAVKNAVSALKATADIVLLANGIGVIKDAIIESRKIFARLYSYSLYRISESLRLVVTITVLGLLYRLYPLTPLQIILIALLNDIPIISLAFDKVKIATRPAKIDVKRRFILSSLYGFTGVANSLILFFVVTYFFHLPWDQVQTIYFLKLTVSGHMLIYVAHTKDRWWKFLPSKEVIIATSVTQFIATLLALTGFLMPGPLPLSFVALAWIWSFGWMQIAEIAKVAFTKVTEG